MAKTKKKVSMAERLRAMRAKAKLSLRRLAAKAGISHQAVVNAEEGRASSSTVLRIFLALGVDLERAHRFMADYWLEQRKRETRSARRAA